jgi:hypothetical protein
MFHTNNFIFRIEIFIECRYIENQNKLRIINNKVNIRFGVLKAVDDILL